MKKKQLSTRLFLIIYSAVIALTVLCDQLSKSWMEKLLGGGNRIEILGDWLTLEWTLNRGSAFGGFQNAWLLFFICTLVGLPAFFLLLWRSRVRSVWGRIGFSFIIGGTIGNAVDRFFYETQGFFRGAVRDFISVRGFAIFNVADSFLVVGVILACIALLFGDEDGVFRKQKSVKEIAEQQQTEHDFDQTESDDER